MLGKEIIIAWLFNFYYQEDFLIPGILPSLASSRKQIRQRSKSRIYPRRRPQLKQRRTMRVLNFGSFWERTMVDVFAMRLLTTNYLQLTTDTLLSYPYLLSVVCCLLWVPANITRYFFLEQVITRKRRNAD